MINVTQDKLFYQKQKIKDLITMLGQAERAGYAIPETDKEIEDIYGQRILDIVDELSHRLPGFVRTKGGGSSYRLFRANLSDHLYKIYEALGLQNND